MAMEAEAVATRIDREIVPPDRRESTDRRRRNDRRKADGRINKHAPSRSRMQTASATGVGVCISIMLLTVVTGQVAGIGIPVTALAFEAAALAVSLIMVALGSIEQRLTEVRLELMMLNGGRRQADERRQGDRRGD